MHFKQSKTFFLQQMKESNSAHAVHHSAGKLKHPSKGIIKQYLFKCRGTTCLQIFVCFQQGLRTLQDLAPEMRLAMACDLEEEEGAEGEMTGDEVFDSEAGTSVTTTPASTPLPPIDMLVGQTTVIVEPEPSAATEGVITEQVTGLLEHQRPGSELSGLEIITEQPVRSEPLPIRCVSLILYIDLYYM